MLYAKQVQENIDKNKAIQLLRKIIANELNIIYNYWVSSVVIQGVDIESIRKIFLENRDTTQKHVNMLMERIMQLGGNPEIRPMDWDRYASCKYVLSDSWNKKVILQEIISQEECSVNLYAEVAQIIQPKDDTTYEIISAIIDDKYEHLKNLRSIINEEK